MSPIAKLERWIGGIFNWQQAVWEWGETGEKMVFQSFGRMESDKSQKYAWHCIVMDPALKYKWSAKGCVDRKHYICEVPAGRLGERRFRARLWAKALHERASESHILTFRSQREDARSRIRSRRKTKD